MTASLSLTWRPMISISLEATLWPNRISGLARARRPNAGSARSAARTFGIGAAEINLIVIIIVVVEIDFQLVVVRGCLVMNVRMTFSAQSHKITWKLVKNSPIIKMMDLRCWSAAPLATPFSASENCYPLFAPKGAITKVPMIGGLVRHVSLR